MALEDLTGSGAFISSLIVTNPTPDDWADEGDDHVRGIKNVLRNSFPRASGDVMAELVGMVAGFYIVPARWIPLDGRNITEAAYPLLFAALGWTGLGNHVLPDTRGRFLRGWDPAGVLDPGGRAAWTAEDAAIASHHHNVVDAGHVHPLPPPGAAPYAANVGGSSAPGGQGAAITATSSAPTGLTVAEAVPTNAPVSVQATDNRPANFSVVWAIFADQ